MNAVSLYTGQSYVVTVHSSTAHYITFNVQGYHGNGRSLITRFKKRDDRTYSDQLNAVLIYSD